MKMKIKKIGAILAGAVMLSSAVAAAWDPSEHTDFFINPETGEPNAIIVVGANAAASDVTAASWIAAQMGSMAHYDEVIPQYETATWTSIKPYVDDNNNATYNCDAIAVGDTLGDFNDLPYVKLSSLWWDDKDEDGLLEKDESREEVFVNFTQDPMTGIYPIIDLYDLQYRTVIEDDPTFKVWFGGEDNTTPYALVDDPVTVKWLGSFYDIIGWGYDAVSGDDYIVYGTPHYSENECRGDDEMIFDVGETKEFYGWEITLDDINIYENKVQWLIKGPNDETPCEYITAISGYPPDIPPELWDDRHRHCLASVQLKSCEYDVIGITDTICDMDWEVPITLYENNQPVTTVNATLTIFALDTVKTFVGAAGHNKAVARLYALENYGILHDAICIKPCGESDNQWDLDIVWHHSGVSSLGTEAEYVDHDDGDPDFGDWVDVNTNFVDLDGDDAVTAGKAGPWDIVPWSQNNSQDEEGLDYYDDREAPPGTYGDPDGVEVAIAMKLHTLIDIRICGASQTIQLCTFDVPMCGPDDFFVNTGDAKVYLSLTVDDSDDPNHNNLEISNGFSMEQKTEKEPKVVTHFVEIDPMSITVNDDEVTETMKIGYNLILVGGPGLVVCVGSEPKVANMLTKELIDQGLSKVDWSTSLGEYEYIPNAFAEGKDVLIVAGADREATRYAVKTLINDLTQ